MKQRAAHLLNGQLAEKIALQHLLQQGLKLKQKNFSTKSGEIDLIMTDEEQLVFVEVRYRKSIRFGLPEETVTVKKQKKIIQTAQYFLLKKKLSDQCTCRFDIIAIHGTIPNHQIKWIQDAFYSN